MEEDQREQRVLISDPSIFKSDPKPNLEEITLPTLRVMTNIRVSTEELIPYTRGTSFKTDDSNKYKLFIVDEPEEIVGLSWANASLFAWITIVG